MRIKYTIETLNEFRSIKKDIKIIEWNVDNYLLDNTEKKFKQRSHLIDAFFITNADKVISSCLCNNNSISFFLIFLTHQLKA